ncbi:MAG: sugar phosphate isomerase/epimerase [Lachnospiraceae bacterium]|nr:sugar phosphate isomerase/epimerase [Lachnospiraceae bacterium]
MNLGIRLHDVSKEKLNFEELIALVAEKKFTCGHLALSKAFNDFKVDIGAMTPGLAMHIRQVCEKNHVDLCVLGCYLNLCNPDPVKHAEIVEKYKAHIRFASFLNVACVGTETGARNVEYKYDIDNHSEEALETFIENLRPIVKYAEQFGVIFAIEPVWKHIVYNLERAKRVIEAIDSPNLQIIFDPVNLLCPENLEEQDEMMEYAFRELNNHIAVIHCKDYKLENGELVSIAAGTGSYHYPKLMKLIKEHKPYVHVSLENTIPENAIATRDFMWKLYQEA